MSNDRLQTRNIVLLARNNLLEAMRVASGLTIFGHDVSLVLMHRALTEDEANSEQAELLELADIVPKTTVPAMADYFELLDRPALGNLMQTADVVVNV